MRSRMATALARLAPWVAGSRTSRIAKSLRGKRTGATVRSEFPATSPMIRTRRATKCMRRVAISRDVSRRGGEVPRDVAACRGIPAYLGAVGNFPEVGVRSRYMLESRAAGFLAREGPAAGLRKLSQGA